MAGSNAPIVTGPGGVPLVEPQTSVYAGEAGELNAGLKPTYWEKFFETSGISLFEDSPLGAISRHARDQELIQSLRSQGTDKISPDLANKQYPSEVPYTEPMYPEVAKLYHDEAVRKQNRRAWLDRGPELGFAGELGAGAAVGLDPINLIIGSALGSASAALKIGRTFGFMGRLGLTYGENLAANLLGEIPGVIQGKQEHVTPRTPGELLAGAASGAVVGTALHLGLDYAFGKSAEAVRNQPESVVKENEHAAVAMHESGQKIDMTAPEAVQTLRDVGHTMPGYETPYQFHELAHPSDRQYYIPVEADTGTVGVVGSDNPAVVRNFAGTPESPHDGHVVRVEIPSDARMISGDTPLRDLFPEGSKRADILEKMKGILGDDARWKKYEDAFKSIIKSDTHGSLFDLYHAFVGISENRILPHNEIPTQDFARMMDGLGIDGMKWNSKVGGQPVDNRILMFNQDKMQVNETTTAMKNEVPQLTEDQKFAASQFVHSEPQSRDYNPELKAELAKPVPMKIESGGIAVPNEHDAMIKEREMSARAYIAEQADMHGNEHLTEELDRIDQKAAKDMHFEQAAKLVSDCLAGNIV